MQRQRHHHQQGKEMQARLAAVQHSLVAVAAEEQVQ
jgi:hypothetical protein